MSKNSFALSAFFCHRLRVLAMFLLIFTASGCGYTSRSMLSNDFRSIYITPFISKIDITQDTYSANKYRIYRPGLETDITSAVINKFLFDGNLRPVKEESADLVLKGELVDFRKDPLRYNSDSSDVLEYRLNVTVNMSLWNKKDNKLVWQENNFTGSQDFFVSGSQAKSEAQAISDAENDLSRRIVERTVEQW